MGDDAPTGLTGGLNAIGLADKSQQTPSLTPVKKRRGPGRPFVKGVAPNPGGRPPLTEAQRLARSMRAQAQPELVEVLLAIAKDAGADMKDRIAAARALLEEVPAVDADGAAAALTVVIRRQGGDGG